MREPDDSPLATSLILQHSARNSVRALARSFLLPSSSSDAHTPCVRTHRRKYRPESSLPLASEQGSSFVDVFSVVRPSGPATTRSRKRERERKSWRQGRKRSETQNERAPFSTRLYGCFRVSAAPGTSTSPGYMCGRLPYLLRPSNKPQTSSRGKRWHGIRLGWKGYSWEIRGESRGNSLSAALSSLWRRQRRRGNSPLSGDLREISFR